MLEWKKMPNEAPEGYELRYTEGDQYPYYQRIHTEETTFDEDPFIRAAERLRRGVKGRQQLPAQDAATPEGPPNYIMEPDLLETQQGMSLPTGIAFNDAGIPFNLKTGKEVPIIPRPKVLPIAKTPDGYTFAMPKMLDVAGNVMGGVAGAPVKGAEVLLGSGAVRKVPEIIKAAEGPFYSALERAVDNSKVGKADAQQWLGYLKNQPGVKSEELAYVLGDIKGSLTKAEVQDIIKNNKVELKEIGKGDIKAWDELGPKEIKEQEKQFKEFYGYKGSLDEVEEFYSGGELSSPTKYHGYQLPGGPLSRDTEILTRDGWKRIDDVSIGEEIITRKDESGELEWQSIQAVPTVYAEKLYHFYNQSIDMQVTANHKMVVRKRRRSSRGIFRITAEQLWKTSECVIPLTGNWTGKGSKTLFGYDACDVAEFIGWYLAEGSYKHKNGIKNTIQIAQSRAHNPDNCDRLEALFDRLGVVWKYYGNGYGIGSKSINKSLLDLLHSQPTSEGKFIPSLFFNENKHVVNSLLAGLILGDGHHSEDIYDDYGNLRQARKIFFSKSKSLADGVQILALLSGYRASVRKRPTGIYVVGINSKEWNSVDDAKYAIVDYHDFAFCVTVENHCIYVRRNGVAAFTGNSDYKEMLLTLPNSWEKFRELQKTNDARIATLRQEMHGTSGSNEIRAEISKLQNENQNLQKQIREAPIYTSSHWDEPNVLAHVRMNDRTVDGKKTLHIEEIQSDWHQAGRKQGYKLSEKQKADLDNIENKLTSKLTEAEIGNPDIDNVLKIAVEKKVISSDDAKNYKEYVKGENSNIPDAPFKKNWDELALKRMLHKAADEGYEGISWTPGEAQAARYDLSKQVDKIELVKHGDRGTYVRGYKNGGMPINELLKDESKLAGMIGKEAAEKLLKSKVEKRTSGTGEEIETRFLEGDNLKIGGEGMKSFYDKILVDRANNLAKKYGSKVEQRNLNNELIVASKKLAEFEAKFKSKPIPLSMKAEHENLRNAVAKAKTGETSQPIHYLPIPPELRAKAKEGFPMFSFTPTTVPVDYDPFKSEDKKYRLVPVQGNPFK
jgi:hypothetical protein